MSGPDRDPCLGRGTYPGLARQRFVSWWGSRPCLRGSDRVLAAALSEAVIVSWSVRAAIRVLVGSPPCWQGSGTSWLGSDTCHGAPVVRGRSTYPGLSRQ